MHAGRSSERRDNAAGILSHACHGRARAPWAWAWAGTGGELSCQLPATTAHAHCTSACVGAGTGGGPRASRCGPWEWEWEPAERSLAAGRPAGRRDAALPRPLSQLPAQQRHSVVGDVRTHGGRQDAARWAGCGRFSGERAKNGTQDRAPPAASPGLGLAGSGLGWVGSITQQAAGSSSQRQHGRQARHGRWARGAGRSVHTLFRSLARTHAHAQARGSLGPDSPISPGAPGPAGTARQARGSCRVLSCPVVSCVTGHIRLLPLPSLRCFRGPEQKQKHAERASPPRPRLGSLQGRDGRRRAARTTRTRLCMRTHTLCLHPTQPSYPRVRPRD